MKKFAFSKEMLLVSAFMLMVISCDVNATIFKLYKVTTKVERCECTDPELTPPPIEQGLSVYRFTHNRQFQPVCPNSVFFMWEFYASQEFLQAQYITDIMLEDIWIDDHSDGHCSVWCTGNASLISTNSPADIDIPEHYEIEINIALPPDFTDFLGHVSMETFIYDHPWPIITMLWFDDPALRKKYIIQSIYDILPDTDKGMDPVEFCTGKSIQNITDIKLPGNTMDINFTRLYYGDCEDTGFEHKFSNPAVGTKYLAGTTDTQLENDYVAIDAMVKDSPTMTVEELVNKYGNSGSRSDNIFNYTFMVVDKVTYRTEDDCLEVGEVVADPNDNTFDVTDNYGIFYDNNGGSLDVDVTCSFWHYCWHCDPNSNIISDCTPAVFNIDEALNTYTLKYGINPKSCRIGRNWTHNYNIAVRYTGEQIGDDDLCYDTYRLFAGNAVYDFRKLSDSSSIYYTSAKAPGIMLSKDGDLITVYMKDGIKWNFDTSTTTTTDLTYYINYIEDRYGNSMDFSYTDGLLSKITNDAGRYINLYYDSDYMLDYIEDSRGRQWTYKRDASYDLVEVEGPATTGTDFASAQYTYTAADSQFPHQILTQKDFAGQIWSVNYYNEDGRIEKQTYGDSDFTAEYQTNENGVVECVNVYDRCGNPEKHYLTETGLLDELHKYVNKKYWAVTDYVYDFELDPTLTELDGPRLLKKVILPSGEIYEYDYNEYGNLTKLTHKANTEDEGISRYYSYTGSMGSNLAYVIDENGNRADFTYSSDLLTEILLPETAVTDSQGNVTMARPRYAFEYNDFGLISKLELPDANILTYEYVYNASGAVDYMTISLNKDEQGVSDAIWQYDYNAQTGLVEKVITPSGVMTAYEYNQTDRLTTVRNGLDEVTKIAYNPMGLVSKISSQIGQSYNEASSLDYSFAYSILDQLTTITDSLGRITQFGYDANDRRTYIKDPKALQEEFKNIEYEYNSKNLLESVKLPESYGKNVNDENLTLFNYDEHSRLISVTDPKDGQTLYGYDKYSRLTEITYPNGAIESFNYDNLGRIVLHKKPSGDSIHYKYDASGRVIGKATDQTISGKTDGVSFADEFGIPAMLAPTGWITVPDEASYSGQYSESISSGASFPIQMSTTPGSYLVQVWYPDVPTSGIIGVEVYDGMDYSTPIYTTTIDQQEGGGQWINIEMFDIETDHIAIFFNQISGTVRIDAARILPCTIYGYDIMGRIVRAGDHTFSYYPTGEKQSETDMFDRTVSYEYYPDGNVKTLTYPDGYSVSYSYDNAGRMQTITDSNGKTLAIYERDESGRIVRKVTVGGGETVYDYEDRGENDDNLGIYIDKIDYLLAANSEMSVQYTRDLAGNVTSRTQQQTVQNFFYDKNYWLTIADGVEYKYNNILQRTSVTDGTTSIDYTASTDGMGMYSSVGGTNITYDANGNMDLYGDVHMVYDVQNRLTALYSLDSDPNNVKVCLYGYDAFGRRVSKADAVGIMSKSGDVSTSYCYSGDNIIAEYNVEGELVRRYVYGENVDEVIALIDVQKADDLCWLEGVANIAESWLCDEGDACYNVAANYVAPSVIDFADFAAYIDMYFATAKAAAMQDHYYGYFADELGSIVGIYATDSNGQATGLVETYKYDAFGTPSIYSASGTKIDTSSIGNQYMFTGRQFDKESDMYCYRSRFYSPSLGIFISQDPQRNVDSMNMYAYCRNNPVNNTDPYGKLVNRVDITKSLRNLDVLKNPRYDMQTGQSLLETSPESDAVSALRTLGIVHNSKVSGVDLGNGVHNPKNGDMYSPADPGKSFTEYRFDNVDDTLKKHIIDAMK